MLHTHTHTLYFQLYSAHWPSQLCGLQSHLVCGHKGSESHQNILKLSRTGAVTLTSLNTVQSYEGWNFSCSSGGRFSIFSRSCLCLRSAPFSCKNNKVLSLQSTFYSLCFNLSNTRQGRQKNICKRDEIMWESRKLHNEVSYIAFIMKYYNVNQIRET